MRQTEQTELGEPQGFVNSSELENKTNEQLMQELTKKLSDTNITEEQKQTFKQTFKAYVDVVSRSDFDLGRYRQGEHTIKQRVHQ